MGNRKPIFIVLLSSHTSWAELEGARNVIKKRDIEKDYHVIVTRNNTPEIDFKMFSENTIDPIELEGLKLLVLKGEINK